MSKGTGAKAVSDLEQLFHEMMMMLGQAAGDGMVSIVNEHELTMPQMLTLAMLEHGPQTVSGLSDALHLTPGAVSRLVERLVRRQFVCREEGDGDRRRKMLSLTAEGRLLQGELERARIGSFAKAMSELDPTLATDLRDVLARVVTAMRSRGASLNGMATATERRQPLAASAPRKQGR